MYTVHNSTNWEYIIHTFMRGFSLGVEHSLYTKYIHEISGLESVFRQKTSTRIRSPSDDVIPDRNKMIKMFMLQIGNLETV